MNSISIMGRMCADAELRTTQLGTPIVSCRVAVFRTKEQTDFFQVVFWGNKERPERANTLVARAKKGNTIGFTGSMQSRTWEDNDGKKRTTWELVARDFTFAGSAPQEEPQQNPFVDLGNETGGDLPF